MRKGVEEGSYVRRNIVSFSRLRSVRFYSRDWSTSLFSFAKYLELLIYSPAIINLAAPLCEHTTLPPRPWAQSEMPLPKMRMNIVRHFGYKCRQLSFTISAVEDVFEVSVPRLQIIRGKPAEKEDDASQEASTQMEPDRRALRREIMKWWQGLAEHMDQLVGLIQHICELL